MDNNCVKYPYPTRQLGLVAGHGFWVCVHSDLDLGDDLCLVKVMKSLGHGQQLCEILSRSDKGVRSHDQDTMWREGQTDGQTGWFLYTPKLCGGIKICVTNNLLSHYFEWSMWEA